MSEDAYHPEPIFDFQRIYCTVCLFLQPKLFEIRNEKQSEGPLFHLPHQSNGEDCKKQFKKPPKPVTFKNHFLRWSPPKRFGVCLPRVLEMGPRLYMRRPERGHQAAKFVVQSL